MINLTIPKQEEKNNEQEKETLDKIQVGEKLYTKGELQVYLRPLPTSMKMEKLTIGLENFKIFHQLKQTKELAENENDFYVEEPRSIEEIVEASGEFLEKVWFNRHLVLKYRIETGKESVDPEIWKGALNSAQKVIEKYGEENLGPYSDFEWGMINGKLSALRWVLGEDWDMLDT